jgi:hypothetical protein
MKRPDPKPGDVVGRLTILAAAEPPIYVCGRKRQAAWFRCRCACGTERLVAGANLKAGSTRSCGCLRADTRGELNALWRRAGAIPPEAAS